MLSERTQYAFTDDDIYTLYVRFQNETLNDAIADCPHDRNRIAHYQQLYPVLPKEELLAKFWSRQSDERLDYLQELIEGYAPAAIRNPVVAQTLESSFQERLRRQKMTALSRAGAYLD